MKKLKLVYIKNEFLHLLEGNPRKILDPDAKEKLKGLIKEHNFQEPLQIFKEKKGGYSILCGNHRWQAGCELGMKEFPCIVYEGTREEALARAISDNKSNLWTEWDIPGLKDMIAEIDTGDFDIGLTGFEQKELDEMFGYEDKGLKEINEIDLDKEEDTSMEVLSFLIPKPIKKNIEQWIEYITGGEAVIRKFPSVELDLSKFISRGNLPKTKISEDEAFYAFIALSFFNYLKQIKYYDDKKLFKMDFIGTQEQIKKIFFAIDERIKQYDKVPRNPKMTALLDLL